MELYYIIAVTDADRGEAMNALFREAGLPMILSAPGRGTAKNEHLAIYGLDETPKTVTSSVASTQEAAQLVRAAKRKLFLDIPGNGILLTVPLKSVAGGRTLAYLTNDLKTGGMPHMEFNHELIVVILNEGYADLVMDAARAAGAGGGTVLHAKGTGSKRGEKFFGVSLADEKDMVYIIAYADEKAAIMRAINENAGPGTKAGAICFSLPVSSVAGLRERDEGSSNTKSRRVSGGFFGGAKGMCLRTRMALRVYRHSAPPHSTAVKPVRAGAVSVCGASSTGTVSGLKAIKTRISVSGSGVMVRRALSV